MNHIFELFFFFQTYDISDIDSCIGIGISYARLDYKNIRYQYWIRISYRHSPGKDINN